MNRIEQLKPLSREHHLSLVLASKAIKTAKSKDALAIEQLCQQIADDFESRWESHFLKEEQTLFTLFENNYQSNLKAEEAGLSLKLRKQHEQMRSMAGDMQTGRVDQLAEFGELLKEHTRLEERLFFPLVSELFTEKELDLIETDYTNPKKQTL